MAITSSIFNVAPNSPDGCHIGKASTDKVGFYGVTPVVQAATLTSVTTTAATSTTNAYGYTTAAQADAIVTAVNALIVVVENVGLAAQS
jgi:UDP-N-acetyl-D-mannosaminuronic acid transferase (WecB/TagA/CpsF family)